MKNLIENDDAISVVVGSILILAVVVTFMSVVTSSWVPIYEGNLESTHSDELFDTFIDFSKQIENADEYPKSTTFKLGTDEMPFISDTNSVGHIEVNSSAAPMTLTTKINRSLSGLGEGDFINVKDLNLSQDAPITNFTFNCTLDNTFSSVDVGWNSMRFPDGFGFELQSDTQDKMKIIIEEVGQPHPLGRVRSDGSNLRIRIEYMDIYGNIERWGHIWTLGNVSSGVMSGLNSANDSDYTYLDIDFLAPTTIYTTALNLEYADSYPVTINNSSYNVTNAASLRDLTQHYMKLPGDGTYNLYYTTHNKIVGSDLVFRYSTTTGTIGGTKPDMNGMIIGGGTLTLRSDYNFFVDQSYIYDSGAIILNQYDGAVFKVGDGPIYVTSDSNNNLILDLKTAVLQGDCQAGGNGIETIQTQLDGSYCTGGFTDNVTITKSTIPELSDMWNSYFEELNSTICTTTNANSTYDSTNMTLHISSSTPNILLTLEQKEIEIS